MFTGFTPEAIDFLWGLRLNNNREWFQEHKQQYQTALYAQVFQPFLNGEFWLHGGVLPSNFCPFPVLSMSVEICVFQRVFRPLGYTGEGYIFR